MRKKAILFFLTIFISGAFAFSEGVPVLVFDKKTFNFGKIEQNTTVRHTFIFRNKGKSTLLIDRVMRGCGCTKINLSSKEIPAGEEGKLEVELNTEHCEGKISKQIFVYSNDPVRPMTELTVKADVFTP